MQELDKIAMGRRIRQIRLSAGLRQWELAKLLGTTQSAVHKYEHGVVPEPRRLIELARTGGTSIEWVLTGRHWENGSEDQQRVSPEVLQTAHLLRGVDEEGRAALDEALRIIREAVRIVDSRGVNGDEAEVRANALLRDHAAAALEVLECASQIQNAVLQQLAEDARARLAGANVFYTRRAPTTGGRGHGTPPTARRSRS